MVFPEGIAAGQVEVDDLLIAVNSLETSVASPNEVIRSLSQFPVHVYIERRALASTAPPPRCSTSSASSTAPVARSPTASASSLSAAPVTAAPVAAASAAAAPVTISLVAMTPVAAAPVVAAPVAAASVVAALEATALPDDSESAWVWLGANRDDAPAGTRAGRGQAAPLAGCRHSTSAGFDRGLQNQPEQANSSPVNASMPPSATLDEGLHNQPEQTNVSPVVASTPARGTLDEGLTEQTHAISVTASRPASGTLDESRDNILRHIAAYEISFIEAATGMGKSSKVPQFVLDADPRHVVWQLQPRRLAAKRLAEYVSATRSGGGGLGNEVGYRVRGDEQTSESTRLVYMTTGYFLHFALHHFQRDNIGWCTHLFVDEVHEASEEIELVLLLSRVLCSEGRLPFKVVVLSATLDFLTLHSYFTTAPVASELEDMSSEIAAVLGRSRAGTWHTKAGGPSSLDVRLVEGDGPLGITCAWHEGNAGMHEYDVDMPGWVVAKISNRCSVAIGRVRVGDRLDMVSGQPAAGISGRALHHALEARPLLARFLRRALQAINVAPASLQLCPATPHEVTIRFLDELEDCFLESLGVTAPNFSVSRFRGGVGPEPQLMDFCARLLLEECRSPDDCALVFLPGITEIEHFKKTLERRIQQLQLGPIDIVVLHSITVSQTSEVRRPQGLPVAYVATSIAETSITLPELTVVFDFGLARGCTFDPTLEMEQLTTRMASRTSAKQRAGRVGRTRPGRVYRLYPSCAWEHMPTYDSWGALRNMESMVLLLTKTLVPFMGVTLQECVNMLVNKPSPEDLALTLSRLLELEALVEGSALCAEMGQTQQYTLSAFGDFAVNMGILGPRLSRLVYCSLIFGCPRAAIVVAAFHTIVGKGDIFTAPREFEKDDPPVEILLSLGVGEAEDGLGIQFQGVAWKVEGVCAGSWSEQNGVQKADTLLLINGQSVDGLMQDEVMACMRLRPITFTFQRIPSTTSVPVGVFEPIWKIARLSLDLDRGNLSEPAMLLRLFDGYLSRTLGPIQDVCSMHKLRLVDAMTREVCDKLKGMYFDFKHQNKQQVWDRDVQHVIWNIHYDAMFWEAALAEQLCLAKGANRHFVSDCFDDESLENLGLTLCAAFSTNFIYSTLPVRKGPAVPVVTLRSGPAELEPDVLAAQIHRTYGARLAVKRVEGQPPGNFELNFPACHGAVPPKMLGGIFTGAAASPGGPVVAFLGAGALANMVARRDGRHRLLLLQEDGAADFAGELHVDPSFEWHVLRAPWLPCRPALRASPVASAHPAPSIGPSLPPSGPGAGGFRVAVAAEVEATKVQAQRKGRNVRTGKTARCWLTAWLPNDGHADLAMLMAFWPRDFRWQEDLSATDLECVAYSSVSLGDEGPLLRLPPGRPLRGSEREALVKKHAELQRALRVGSYRKENLPSLSWLQRWGRQCLAGASVEQQELKKEEPIARPCQGGCGFAVTWHPTHCCNCCAEGKSVHGHRCEKIQCGPRREPAARPCLGVCGFAVTWHPSHCCNCCAEGISVHGHRCEKVPYEKEEEDEEQPRRMPGHAEPKEYAPGEFGFTAKAEKEATVEAEEKAEANIWVARYSNLQAPGTVRLGSASVPMEDAERGFAAAPAAPQWQRSGAATAALLRHVARPLRLPPPRLAAASGPLGWVLRVARREKAAASRRAELEAVEVGLEDVRVATAVV